MWPFLEYFDRKIVAHHIGSLFWTINNILAPQAIFFLMILNLRIRKARYGFARKSPTTFSATKGTKRANSKTNSSKTNSILCLLTDVGHRHDYQWGPLLTKNLRCDARASTLLPGTLVGGVSHTVSAGCIVLSVSLAAGSAPDSSVCWQLFLIRFFIISEPSTRMQHARTHTRTYARMHARNARTHAHTHARTHACTHASTHAHTHTRNCSAAAPAARNAMLPGLTAPNATKMPVKWARRQEHTTQEPTVRNLEANL